MASSRAIYEQAVIHLTTDLADICQRSPTFQSCLDACRARAAQDTNGFVESINFALFGSLELPPSPLICRIQLVLEDGRFYSFDRTVSMAEAIRAMHLLESALASPIQAPE